MTKKEKMVVTGGAGFVGSHLVDALLAAGKEVHVVDNYAGGKRSDRINSAATYHEVDITNYDALLPILKDAVGVFHEAALPRVQFSIQQPLETMNANVVGTANVLVGAQKAGVRRVVCASSGSVYGDQEAMPYHEDLTPNPRARMHFINICLSNCVSSGVKSMDSKRWHCVTLMYMVRGWTPTVPTRLR